MCIAVPALVEASIDCGLTLEVKTLGFTFCVGGELVPEAEPGDWVLVHMGFALAVVDQEAAKRQLLLMETLAGGAVAAAK